MKGHKSSRTLQIAQWVQTLKMTLPRYESLIRQLELGGNRNEDVSDEIEANEARVGENSPKNTNKNGPDTEAHYHSSFTEAYLEDENQSCASASLDSRKQDLLYSALSATNSKTSLSPASSTSSLKSVEDNETSYTDAKSSCITQWRLLFSFSFFISSHIPKSLSSSII